MNGLYLVKPRDPQHDVYPLIFDVFLNNLGVLVPVEPCEHGNYDGHFTEYDPLNERELDGHWCPGAGIGQ